MITEALSVLVTHLIFMKPRELLHCRKSPFCLPVCKFTQTQFDFSQGGNGLVGTPVVPAIIYMPCFFSDTCCNVTITSMNSSLRDEKLNIWTELLSRQVLKQPPGSFRGCQDNIKTIFSQAVGMLPKFVPASGILNLFGFIFVNPIVWLVRVYHRCQSLQFVCILFHCIWVKSRHHKILQTIGT